MNCKNTSECDDAGYCMSEGLCMRIDPHRELQPASLVERLRDEADLCSNEGADDIARLLNEAADALSGAQT